MQDSVSSLVRSFDSEDQTKLKEVATVIRKRWRWVAGFCAAAILGTIFSHYVYPSYSARTYLLIDSEQESSGFQALLGSLAVTRENVGLTEVESEKVLLTLKSMEFFRRVSGKIREDAKWPVWEVKLAESTGVWDSLRSFLLGGKWRKINTDLAWVSNRLRKLVSLNGKGRGILEVVVSSGDEELSMVLANAFMDQALKAYSEREERKLHAAAEYIQNKIDETIRKMERTDRGIVTMSTRNANLSMLAPQSAVSEKLLQLKTDIQKHTFTYEQNKKVLDSLRQKLGTSESGPTNNPGVYGLQRTITNLETENSLLSARIESMKTGLDSIVKSNLSLPKEEQSLADLKRQKGLDYYVFDNLYKTLLQIEVKGISVINRIYPLQRITMEDIVLTTRLPPKLTLAFLISFILGSVGVHVAQLLRPVVRVRGDLEDIKLSFLGTVPKIGAKYFKDLGATSALCRFDMDSKESVAFKQIRARLLHLAQHSGPQARKVLCVLSYGNGEGKTFVSSNIAVALAHMGKKTLLIDFDIRRASLSKLFNHPASPGVCEFLDKQIHPAKLIQKGVLPQLDFLPAGQLGGHTTERVSNAVVSRFITEMKAQYDFVVFDSAPILVAHESSVLAKECDFAVLMATSWKTRVEYVKDAAAELRSVRPEAIHFILNKVEEPANSLVTNYYYMGSTKRRSVQTELTH